MEQKAQLLDEENTKIKSELQFWNDVYAQDTGVSQSEAIPVSVTSPPISVPIPMPSPSDSVQIT